MESVLLLWSYSNWHHYRHRIECHLYCYRNRNAMDIFIITIIVSKKQHEIIKWISQRHRHNRSKWICCWDELSLRWFIDTSLIVHWYVCYSNFLYSKWLSLVMIYTMISICDKVSGYVILDTTCFEDVYTWFGLMTFELLAKPRFRQYNVTTF